MDVQAFRFQIRKFFWSSWKGKNISNWWQGFWIEEHLPVQFGDNDGNDNDYDIHVVGPTTGGARNQGKIKDRYLATRQPASTLVDTL